MSKPGKRIGIAVIVLAAALGGGWWVLNQLGRIVERGVETVGPTVTGTDVSLGGARISIFSGAGSLRRLSVANPKGYSDAEAFHLGEIAVAVDVASVTADVIRIRSLVVDGPRLVAEFNAAGGSNLKTILDHAQAAARGGSAAQKQPPGEAQRKLIIDEFRFLNAEVRVLAPSYDLDKTLRLGPIQLKGLGAKQGGAAAADIANQMLRPVVDAAVRAAMQEYLRAQRGRIEQKAKDKLLDKLFK